MQTPSRQSSFVATQAPPKGGVESVKVYCRFRPFNEQFEPVSSPCVEFTDDTQLQYLGMDPPKTFMFDRVFGPDATQETVFDCTAKHVLSQVFQGCNGTIFCYGQTGAGKSFTMTGPSVDSFKDRGLIPRVFDYLFDQCSAQRETFSHVIHCSFFEIYMERIRDLLADDPVVTTTESTPPTFLLPNTIHPGGENRCLPTGSANLQIRERKDLGVYVENLSSFEVSSADDLIRYLKRGNKNRVTAATNMNDQSSRSHSIFNVSIETEDLLSGAKRRSQLYLIDLAGSEKAAKTGVEGLRLDEARLINLSLSTLGNVINALSTGRSKHIPYRDSKLTRILQDSLGGTSSTALIICCSPSKYNEVETLSTLRFGERAKNVKNTLALNQEFSLKQMKAMLEKANTEIARLNGIIAGMVQASQLVSESILEKTMHERSLFEQEEPVSDFEVHVSGEVARVNALNQRMNTCTNLDELRDTLVDATQRYLNSLSQILSLRSQVSANEARMGELEDAIISVQRELDQEMGISADLRLEVDNQVSANNELRARYDSLGAHVESMKLELNNAQDKLKASEGRLKALQEQALQEQTADAVAYLTGDSLLGSTLKGSLPPPAHEVPLETRPKTRSVVFEDDLEKNASFDEQDDDERDDFVLYAVLKKETISDQEKIMYFDALRAQFQDARAQIKKLVRALSKDAFTVCQATLQAATMEERFSTLCNNAKILKQYRHLDTVVKQQAVEIGRLADDLAEARLASAQMQAELREAQANNAYLTDQLDTTKAGIGKIMKYKDDHIRNLQLRLDTQQDVLEGLQDIRGYSITRDGVLLANVSSAQADEGFLDCNGCYSFSQGLQHFSLLPFTTKVSEARPLQSAGILLPEELRSKLAKSTSITIRRRRF
ncbi:Kinesin-1 [Giardia muris]|uniref:Kinesin-like protein n=1 Tax=Giardia muris TaxID=5742 RepID=A0A4Z1T6Q1_GIAMU|nr:Kinesin-1 [Giardia muris]|eukprot:TNJ29743.1 Kinesin-1 [Giardia muris]